MASEIDVSAHLELVERVVRRLVAELDLSCDQDDLRSWGNQGLVEAGKRFDAARGVRFSTFAYYRVRGAVIDGVRQQGFLKRRAYAKLKAFEAADSLAEPLGEANAQGPQASLAQRASDVDDALAKVTAAYVLAAVGQDRQEDEHTPASLFESAEDVRSVRAGLDVLPDNERQLVQAVYFEGATIEQAGARLGLSKSWASRLHAKALERMRNALLQS
jgi:RNA polymerase sigma factor for flagellar operon FliA